MILPLRFAVTEALVTETITHPAVVAFLIIGMLTFVVVEFCSQEMVTLLVVEMFLIIAMHKYAVITPSA